jgi:hypothetical protein
MKRTSIAVGALLAAGLTAAGEARAQFWLSDRAAAEGRGIRAGDFELHPSIGGEFGYDSNATGGPPGSALARPALRLRITPSFAISTLGGQRTSMTSGASPSALPTANFRANVALIYHHFFDVPGAMPLMAGVAGGNLGAQAGFRLDMFPGRTWQFSLFDDFSRIVQGTPEFGVSLFTYNRIQNVGGFEAVYAPNGGVLDARLTYTNRVAIFENAQFDDYNFMSNEVALRNRWRFLPKTALMWEGVVAYMNYFNPMATTGLFNSLPVRTRIGLNGLLTEKLGLLVMVGYQGTYFSSGDNADTIVGQAELRYLFSRLTSFRVGLIRDVQPSLLGNYYIRNQAYAGINQTFGGRFYVSAEGSIGWNQYGIVSDPTGTARSPLFMTPDPTGRFGALRVQAVGFGEYRFSDVVGVNATLQASVNSTDASVSVAGMPQSLSWVKLEAYLGARVNW